MIGYFSSLFRSLVLFDPCRFATAPYSVLPPPLHPFSFPFFPSPPPLPPPFSSSSPPPPPRSFPSLLSSISRDGRRARAAAQRVGGRARGIDARCVAAAAFVVVVAGTSDPDARGEMDNNTPIMAEICVNHLFPIFCFRHSQENTVSGSGIQRCVLPGVQQKL